ncbi:hypothetical protein G6011_09220 [Alternaria panax]|uniref:Uncharacterized protein n=1 Tax=Alternaria panax TaxID=48097 RepID=A0AAD4IAW6_9PLEO|nr:hypothetical protein G6011_09220 [Alternaria panax]
MRNLPCEYTQDVQSTSKISSSEPSPGHKIPSSTYNTEAEFNDLSFQLVPWLVPASQTSIGTFTRLDHQLLQYYKAGVWREFVVRDDAVLNNLHENVVPQLGVSHPYLLYALLSISANRSNELVANKTIEKQALLYRQKTFSAYKKALEDITAENYEAVLVTGGLLLALVAPPSSDDDDEYLEWMLALLKLSEGLRILASLRWAQGMERLSIYPLVRRELRTLPPPPVIDIAGVDAPIGPLGTTPDSPNPAPTYSPTHFPMQTRLFLPPPLMQLLGSIVRGKESGSVDWHRPALLPVFHALSPIFLSLYHYHLNPDLYVRIFCFTSFLMPEFIQLVRDREPRALVLVAWFFALAEFVPKGFWVGGRGRKIVGILGREIRARSSGDDGFVEGIFEGAQRIFDVLEREGDEAAMKSVFEGWPGVSWEDGPDRDQEWESGLLRTWVL